MSEEDDAAYRRRIIEILTRHGFDWVVEQAEAQISEGKPNTKQVSEREVPRAEADSMFRISAPRRRRASLITSEPYSQSERLEILLQAIEAAINHRAELEQAVLDQLSGIAAVNFLPDAPREDTDAGYLGIAHHLDRSRPASRRDLQRRTESALAAMRGRDHAG